MRSFFAPISRVTALALATLLAFAAFGVAQGELRTWADKTGKFKIQAKYVSHDAGKVTLQLSNGKTFEIELSKLSLSDKKYVERQTKKEDPNPFKEVPSDPKKGKPAVTGEGKVITPDWTGVRQVDLVPTNTEWKVTAQAGKTIPLKTVPVGLPPKTDFFEGAKGLAVNPSNSRAVVGYLNNRPGQAVSSRIILADLAKGKVIGQTPVPGAMVPIALHDDGTQVLMKREEFGFGKQDQLELWTVSAKGGSPVLQFAPYGDLTSLDRDIRWAAFVDDKHLLTASNKGKVALWEMPAVKPLYFLTIQGGSVPALSPDRKLLAFTTGKELGILDIAEGKVIALQASPNTLSMAALGFSPDAKWLACATFDQLYIWDVDTGTKYRDISTKGTVVNGQLLWTSDKHILIGNRTLIDMEMQIPLWSYNGHEQVQLAGGLAWFVVHDHGNSPGGLIPSALPHTTALLTQKKAAADPNFIVLKEGTTVKLNVSALPDPAQRDKVAAALTSQLEKNGCKVSSAGSIDLIATSDMGKIQEIVYYTVPSFGKFGPPRFGPRGSIPAGAKISSVKVQEYFVRLKFVFQGKTVWEVAADNIPSRIRLADGETVEQHLRKHEHPNYAFLEAVRLPRFLLRLSGSGTLGTSRVSLAGVR